MSKVDEYTGNGMIVVSDGEVWAVDDSGLPDVIGEIGRVELSIEMPENLIGIYRVEHIMLFDEDDEELYDDQTLVDNTEYHSERALVKAVAKKYGISERDLPDEGRDRPRGRRGGRNGSRHRLLRAGADRRNAGRLCCCPPDGRGCL